MNKVIIINLLCLFSFLLLLPFKEPKDITIGTPKIEAGTANINGKISSPNETHKNNGSVEIFVPHPISGEISKYKTVIDESGKFSIVVDVETDISLIGLYTSLKPYNSLLVKVKSGEVTNIDITYNQNLDIEDVQTEPEMDKYQMMRSLAIINQMLGVYDAVPEPQVSLYNKSPEAFLNHVNTRVSVKLEILNKDSLLSREIKEILAKDFRIWNYRMRAFNYERSMKFNYRNIVKDTTAMPKMQKIDKSYFGFLKDFDLNNPQYLICSSFMDFQKEILKNGTLAIPKIAERDVPSWMASVKAILSNLVGFKDGQYYDILAANAYGRQLNEEVTPLTEKQKKNISDYWKEGEIAKILLRKNRQVVELDNAKSSAGQTRKQ
ncbi:hypothetical protein [Pedobacter foliorum]|uniref:hypothetical protein n=1 Tax=Pedobacter foliorum TaxID=2739058 RepID=UPI0015647B2B|nr:hypothetical protein [Pedobacter foliorum]NRF41030.1 hypothetical protein [Pedobacter foliorum]